MINRGIIVFIKNPELGKAKTRIAREVGDEKALEIYKKLLTYTRTLVSSVDARRYLYYADYINETDAWSLAHFEKRLQVEGDLGNKMSTAFAECITEYEKTIIIGSDCPQITEEHISKAFDELDKQDVVLGPTYDGGYYLLGMKKHHAFLFEDIPWSSPTVYRDTVEKIDKYGLSYSSLEKLSDIDYIEDWEKYGW